tara:strand:+ start:118 stop:666 length:549 start_codon:yes stop_codon:yes gene_type:complete
MTAVVGKVVEVDPKMNKNNQLWLLKFSVESNEGTTVWLGARPTNQKSLIDRVLQERDLPSKSTWEIEYDMQTDTAKDGRTFENNYVTAAKTVDAGTEVTPTEDTPAPTGSNVSSRDALILRQVAFKGAISILVASEKTDGSPEEVERLTNLYEKILLGQPLEEPEPTETEADYDKDLFEEAV